MHRGIKGLWLQHEVEYVEAFRTSFQVFSGHFPT